MADMTVGDMRGLRVAKSVKVCLQRGCCTR